MISKTSDGFLFTRRKRKYLKLLCKTQSNYSTKLEFTYLHFAKICMIYFNMLFMHDFYASIMV